MDFETRRDVGIETTEMFYGKNSDQYAIKEKLIEMENYLIDHRFIYLYKRCKNEFIVHKFKVYSGMILFKKKIYYDKWGNIRKCKTTEIPEVPIHEFVCDMLYDYVFIKGYTQILSITEEIV